MLLPALALSSAFLAPHAASRALSTSKVAMNGGKGFGGGEATRDPAPTVIDPNDPKGKQQAIHKAESFAEYLAKRSAGGGAAPAAVGSVVPTPNAGTALVSDFTCTWLSASEKAALKATADALSAPNKGFLASDESAGPWLRAGHVDAAKAPGLSEHISGVILHWETLFQSDAAGNKMVDLITRNGMIPGIKLDKGYDTAGIPGTAVGPLGHPETWDKGIDDLDARPPLGGGTGPDRWRSGARFAKWRNVLQIDPVPQGLPSDLAITLCVHNLAQYAVICQRSGLVPIVEPEIVPNGDHDISACAVATERVLVAQFEALKAHGCYLEGAVLKPNMVKNGLTGPKATPEEIAAATVTVLKRTVPVAMPGIFFLSGETALDEDNEEEATNNLNAINRLYPDLPWSVSFSYGKASQKTTIVTWMGDTANDPAAQQAILARSKANGDACQGKYVKGSCASVGVDGNILQAAGAY
ncbi:fructose-1,6-bisphosphate aldolase [Emiliania huxleyi CCMP1516]|uniref:fructose-bisphosphate aldolase n=2 Tax=Emiliania huxleyi TaxID=2903 RepID=A0A0D3I5V0_EMIH1|nr:fructose-1,6-bisphosphate aldolase [Emiliania huxleyi CCMP1516]EOD06635.1 fructose-1,6-bisphosphate aldolase [Emiliania huxleyi CCMP1516]|eukprot:XP_005759064.1 fructose-1,6-bisphosphate aldolase [Emiliania huxleyi CCMP1516]